MAVDLNKGLRFRRWLYFVLGVVMITAVSIGFFIQMNESLLNRTKTVNHSFEVKPGESLIQVTQRLEDLGLIDCGLCVRIHYKIFPETRSIRKGLYAFNGERSTLDLYEDLYNGNTQKFLVTLVEGLTLNQWLETLWQHPKIRPTIDQTLDRDGRYQAIVKALSLDRNWPEGLFLPETYSFEANTTEVDILKRAQTALENTLAKAWQGRQADLPLKTAYEALTLASIVEKETGQAFERPIIAGVFTNRLRKNMRLETDPTVIYGIKNFDGNIRRKHLREKTPYNTYQMRGLPPTPIAAASEASIQAVMHPQETSAIFFVAKGDGSHVFSETLDAHEAAVRAYQLNRRADYRSAPKNTSQAPKSPETK